MKKLGLGLLVLTTLLLALFGAKRWQDSRFFSAYDADLPLHARVVSENAAPDYSMSKIYFESVPGEEVPTLLARPAGDDSPLPCIVLLHGIGQKKEFLHDLAPIFCPAGFAMATFDQYTRGERKLPAGAGPLENLQAFKARASKTVTDTRRLLDYLGERPDIDSTRLYLLGVSYGAVTGSVAMALDARFIAGVLLYGGGDFSIILDSPAVDEELGAFANLIRPLTSAYLRAADPILHVGGIAPRPVLFQNGKADQVVVPAAGRALQEAAGEENREIIWYEGDHVGLDPDLTQRVIDDARDWLIKQDLPFRDSR